MGLLLKVLALSVAAAQPLSSPPSPAVRPLNHPNGITQSPCGRVFLWKGQSIQAQSRPNGGRPIQTTALGRVESIWSQPGGGAVALISQPAGEAERTYLEGLDGKSLNATWKLPMEETVIAAVGDGIKFGFSTIAP